MNMVLHHKEIKQDIFDNVLVGQVFLVEEGKKVVAFLGIDSIKNEYGDVIFNAVNLETGEPEEFSALDPVIFPYDVEFTITY